MNDDGDIHVALAAGPDGSKPPGLQALKDVALLGTHFLLLLLRIILGCNSRVHVGQEDIPASELGCAGKCLVRAEMLVCCRANEQHCAEVHTVPVTGAHTYFWCNPSKASYIEVTHTNVNLLANNHFIVIIVKLPF
eukprot:scaffold292038_cov21-Tisochrysis_lutea.AAC.1